LDFENELNNLKPFLKPIRKSEADDTGRAMDDDIKLASSTIGDTCFKSLRKSWINLIKKTKQTTMAIVIIDKLIEIMTEVISI